ncbi:MAG: DUF1810 family protein [Acidovorax sp.]|uniref:DUF1810 family protein n=1 Tax=Acidovorax sp. TaxID=1872122 RepID=UPI00391987D5
MPLTPVLGRFLKTQEPVWPRVIAELRAGKKRTHWMWAERLIEVHRCRHHQQAGSK